MVLTKLLQLPWSLNNIIDYLERFPLRKLHQDRII
jgi:hypothetical protein